MGICKPTHGAENARVLRSPRSPERKSGRREGVGGGADRHPGKVSGKIAGKSKDEIKNTVVRDDNSNNMRAAVFMVLLAVQIGIQPVLVNECINKEVSVPSFNST